MRLPCILYILFVDICFLRSYLLVPSQLTLKKMTFRVNGLLCMKVFNKNKQETLVGSYFLFTFAAAIGSQLSSFR